MSGYIGVQPVPQATQRREYFTATNGQATFNTNGYTPNYIDVYMNGVKLSPADFTASNGSDVVLASGATTGDLVQVVSFTPFNVANQTFIGDVNLSSGAYKIGGNTAINSSRGGALTSLALTGNATFGDNDKAIFGAELEIYSDATHARIREYGSGQLKIQGDNMQLLTSDGASTYLEGNASTSAVTLYHASNSPRLTTTSTGVEITGTLTSDGLTVDGNGAFSGADTYLAFIETDLTNESTRLRQTSGSLYIQKANNSGGFLQNMAQFNTNGDISFYEDTGTTAKFVWKSADERLGIGTDSPASMLDIKGSIGNSTITLNSAAAIDVYPSIGKLRFYSNDNSTNSSGEVGSVEVIGIGTWNGAANSAAMTFNLIQGLAGTTSPVEAMRIDSSGNVKIGTVSGTGKLTVSNNQTAVDNLELAAFSGSDVNQRLTINNFFCGSDEDRVGLLFENQGTINMRVWMGDDGKLYSSASNPISDNSGNRFIQNTSNYTIDFNSQKSDTNQPTGNSSGNYWKLGNWTGAGGGDSLRIEIDSTSGYSYNAKPAGTTIINYTRTNGGSASNAVEGGYYATSANASPVVHDVVYVQISSTEYEIYVKAAGYAELAPFARTNGASRFTPSIVNTGSTSRPNNSYSGMGTIMYQSVGNATNDMAAPTRVGFSSTGNIIMSNGSGIDFSATPNGPASVTSELLDFYEEGTWSPKITGNSGAFSQTYTQQSGRYTRIGNFVYMTYDVHLTDAGSPQGTYMVLGNLPFTAMSGNHGGSFNVTYYTGWQSLNTSHIGGYIGGSNAYLMNGSDDYIRIADGNHSASSRLIGSGWFMVA